jgi:hypothetical protein
MAGENRVFLLFVKQLPCLAEGLYVQHPCGGPTEANHAGRRGVGQKAHDETAIPLCTAHHRQWHDHRGPFRDWTAQRRRDWADGRIEETQAKWRAARVASEEVAT